jgi:DNA-binding transcriptional ArsR family regulator
LIFHCAFYGINTNFDCECAHGNCGNGEGFANLFSCINKILLKFFLNPETKIHIRALSNELDESTNAVRLELNRLLEAKMLTSERESNRIMFRVNELHPLYVPVRQMIQQYVGVDEIIKNVIRGLGNINKIYL